MSLPIFPTELLELPDEELGFHLMAYWSVHHAEKLNIPTHLINLDFFKLILEQSLKMDTDNIEHIALEKAIVYIAKGEVARGGKLFREHMMKDAYHLAALNEVVTGSIRQTENAKKPRTQPFQALIISIVENKPDITQQELTHTLNKNPSIVFNSDGETLNFDGQSISIAGLKDRLLRARKKIKSR